jgi:hypothetical protein
MLFIVLLYLFPQSEMLITIWQIWVLYYYTTLALRENILKVSLPLSSPSPSTPPLLSLYLSLPLLSLFF